MKPDNRLTIAFIKTHSDEAARTLERLPPDTVARLFEAVDNGSAGLVLGHMMPDLAAAVLAHCDRRQAAELLDAIPAAAVTRIARTVIPADAPLLHELLRQHDRIGSHRLTRHALNSVGSHMQVIDSALPDDLPAAEILRRVRHKNHETDCEIWLVDRDFRLSGVVTVTALLHAGANDALHSVKRPFPDTLPARMSLIVARGHPAWESRRRLPVTDDDGILVGVIDYRTVLEATRDEAESVEQYDALDSLFALARIYWLAISEILDTLLKPRADNRATARRENDHAQ